ncbi:YdcF family protein [Alphaproteobacteria bacterium]|nr:YdcF family protein [Alphaproteobacteria bacterium]
MQPLTLPGFAHSELDPQPIIIYLNKLLPLIMSPLGLVIFLVVTGICLRRWWVITVSCFVLMLSSLPVTAQFIWQDLEKQYPPKVLNELGSSDAVVVLSGMLSPFEYSGTLHVGWVDPDRFFAGINVLKSGKAPTLIFTRGKMPWSSLPAEGELLKAKAVELGINESQILLSNNVANTAEEAEAVAELISANGIKKIVLITSSFHMPRAKLLFDKQGIDSVPFAVDFKATGKDLNWLSFLPSSDGFKRTSEGIREYIGRIYYKFRFA